MILTVSEALIKYSQSQNNTTKAITDLLNKKELLENCKSQLSSTARTITKTIETVVNEIAQTQTIEVENTEYTQNQAAVEQAEAEVTLSQINYGTAKNEQAAAQEELTQVQEEQQNQTKKENASDTSASTLSEAAEMINNSRIFSEQEKIDTDSKTMKGLEKVINGDYNKSIEIDTNGDGQMETENIAQAIADSYDSVLDLYIQDAVSEVIKKCGRQFYYGGGFLSNEAQDILKEKGIVVNQLDKRTFTFSLVDEKGYVLEDEDGNKGSIIWSDLVIPDGYAQGAEVNLSSMLDLMGYDCISKADYIDNEYNYETLMSEVASGLASGKYSASDKQVTDLYGNVTAAKGSTRAGVHVEYTASTSITEEIDKDKEETTKEAEKEKKEETKEINSEIKKEYKKELVKLQIKFRKENQNTTMKIADFQKLKTRAWDSIAKKYMQYDLSTLKENLGL